MWRGSDAGGAEDNHAVWRQLDIHIADGDERSVMPPAFSPYKAQMPLLFDVAETLAKAGNAPYSKFKRSVCSDHPCSHLALLLNLRFVIVPGHSVKFTCALFYTTLSPLVVILPHGIQH